VKFVDRAGFGIKFRKRIAQCFFQVSWVHKFMLCGEREDSEKLAVD
jgi:hypothetical protein